ncbi:MAG TPA: hypothetical protein VGF99_17170, partial [Myxococcota bacterium]
MHTIAALTTQQLKDSGRGYVLDDHGVDVVVAAFERAYDAGQAFEAAGALMATATVWLATKETTSAAKTLLALLLALQPALAKLDAQKASALKSEAEAAAAKFAAFAGEGGSVVDKVLDAGAPAPTGTTKASPLARFALLGQTPKKQP